jgi:hypothetical protein
VKVSLIEFHVTVNGRRTVVTYIRQEKIAGLLADQLPLGEFLRALVAEGAKK